MFLLQMRNHSAMRPCELASVCRPGCWEPPAGTNRSPTPSLSSLKACLVLGSMSPFKGGRLKWTLVLGLATPCSTWGLCSFDH